MGTIGQGQFGKPPERAFAINKKEVEFKRLFSGLLDLFRGLEPKEQEVMIAQITKLSKEHFHSNPDKLLEEMENLAHEYGASISSLRGEERKHAINAATARLEEIGAALKGLQEMKEMLNTKKVN
jgi:hypothetical protein